MATDPELAKYQDTKVCADLKARHDACFTDWLVNKFFKGTATKDDCETEFIEYRACVLKKLAAHDLSWLDRSNGITKPIDINFEMPSQSPPNSPSKPL